MLRYASFCLLACLVAGVAQGGVQPKISDDRSEFFECKQDQDCTLIPGACPGFVSAVNKRYANAALSYWKHISEAAKCRTAPPVPETLENLGVLCQKNMCAKKPKLTPASRKQP